MGHSEGTVPELKTLVQKGQNEMKEGVTIFKSVGVYIFDILTAKLIYERYKSCTLVILIKERGIM